MPKKEESCFSLLCTVSGPVIGIKQITGEKQFNFWCGSGKGGSEERSKTQGQPHTQASVNPELWGSLWRKAVHRKVRGVNVWYTNVFPAMQLGISLSK